MSQINNSSDVSRHILDYMNANADEFVAWRRDIHHHPELGFEEFRTSDLVAEKLTEWGYTVERNIGGTGIVGQLKRGTGSNRLGLRADMDALPIIEATGLSYASSKPGIMHACGHDGHTAILLSAARYLAQEADFSGTLNLIFQPAEESLGGAVRMLEDGLFERFPCDAIYALHNLPSVPKGLFLFREGPSMASSDYATITLTGVGGHGAKPHQSVDPVVAASSIVMALQTIVSRNANPSELAIVTVGSIKAGIANNVIPHTAVMELSMRALSKETRALIERRVHEIVHAQAASFGVTAHIDFQRGYTLVMNAAKETAFARNVGKELVGEEWVAESEPRSASDDFAFMLEQVPGAYLWLGNGAGDEYGSTMNHNPGYDFNDGILPVAAAYWSLLAVRFLQDPAPAA
jgi:hippurate hydrolase